MDWKSNKKIIKYVIIYLIFFIFFSIFMFVLARYENYLNRQQMLTLMENHPELEAELFTMWKNMQRDPFADRISPDALKKNIRIIEEKYGYELDAIASEPILCFFWGSGILIGTLIVAAFAFGEFWMNRQSIDSRKKLQELYECLEQFQCGEFEYVPDDTGDCEDWMKICESLRELGVYFSGLKERLQQEENSTKALITDISHQLKTPLAALKMSHELAAGSLFSQFCEFSAFSQEEKQEFFKQEAEEIEKLELLLDELVKLSRLEVHMIQLKPVMGGLKKTLTAAVSQVYRKAKNKNIEIQIEMDKDILVCHDPTWTEEAFVNVLDNAVKYSEEHTIVSMRVTRLASNVLVEIEDEGIGIKAEELLMIYQRFYRGTQAKQKVKEGAGIGLYLARMILERQGGTISAKRKMEKGTIFKITLPM